MENASKALLIAGAILLAILIISLGLMAYQQAKNSVGSSNLNKQEIEAFNAQWENYIGKNKTAIISSIDTYDGKAHNASEGKMGTNRWISITKTGTPNKETLKADPNVEMDNPSNSATYEIKAGYKDGLIVGLDWK